MLINGVRAKLLSGLLLYCYQFMDSIARFAILN